MKNTVELMAATLGQKAQSFDHIRSITGLALTDDEFRMIVEADPGRFRLVSIMKRDAEGAVIRPGRIGVRMRTAAVS
jgi:hypothetical protein